MLDATVRGGILIARSPAGRTGAWRDLEAQTRQKQANRKGGVPWSWPSRELSQSSSPLALPCSPLQGPPLTSSRIRPWFFKGRGLLAARGVHHQRAPEATALHVDSVASWRERRPPSRRSAITGSAPTPTPWRTTRCASERAGRDPGGRQGSSSSLGPEKDPGELSG